MKLADEFIQKYNELDDWLRKQAGANREVPFSQAVSIVAQKNRAVKPSEYFLKSIGNLRNAIIHDTKFGKRIIATPDQSVVKEFNDVCSRIFAPKKAIDISTRNIETFPLDINLSCVLPKMSSNDYSQLVVEKEDGSFGMITREGISRWVAKNMDDDVVSLKDVKLENIYQLEDNNSWEFISTKHSIYDAAALFSQDTRRIQALIITENGRPKEKPLGILTFWDISKALGHE